ncbi:MAG TPA: hypothetical protein VMI31_00545 [Fimbriimonadaceae bacterium]|nr:hypothetical protein [Fimbriimonadaceae bacterium]
MSFAGTAFAAHGPAQELGHWLGFAHGGSSSNTAAGVILDLQPAASATGFNLSGTIALPAVQMPLSVKGLVTPFGFLYLTLQDANGNRVGFCDGSVMPIQNFGPGSGQDDLGSLDFTVTDATGAAVTGHMNLLHMYGGQNWQTAGINWGDRGGLPADGQSHGAFLPAGADTGVATSFFGRQLGGDTSSAFAGGVSLPAVQFQMVGTVNARGSIVMMCDGSAPSGATSALIGLLFTGALPAVQNPGNLDISGLAGVASFGLLLPAVQKERGAAMSFSWGVSAGG